MNYTEKEINEIKATEFDNGWRYGLIVGVSFAFILFAIVLYFLA